MNNPENVGLNENNALFNEVHEFCSHIYINI
jgi:hypothetical protein